MLSSISSEVRSFQLLSFSGSFFVAFLATRMGMDVKSDTTSKDVIFVGFDLGHFYAGEECVDVGDRMR